MLNPGNQIQRQGAEPATAMIWIGPDGNVREYSGEFTAFAQRASGRRGGDDVLASFLLHTNGPETGSNSLKERWASGRPVEVHLGDGSRRLLASHPHAQGGTVYLSIRLDPEDKAADPRQFIVDAIALPVWANDLEGNVVFANRAAREMGRKSKGESAAGLAQFIVSRHTNADLLARLQKEGHLENYSIRTVSEDGEECWNSGCATLAEFAGHAVVISAVQDVTDRKQIENQTARAREMLGDAIESLSEGFALYDEEGKLVLFNERYLEMNKAAEDIIKPGMRWEMLMRTLARRGVYADAIGREEQWVSERLVNGVEFIQDYELRTTDGKTCLVSVLPTKLGGFVVTRTDITAMKQVEAAERESDLLVRKVLDTCSAAVIMARIGDGHVLYRSPAAQEMFGTHDTAVEHYATPTDRADYVTDMLADGRVDNYRIDLFNARRERFPALVSGRIAEYHGEEVLVSHVTDLTARLETEALIRKVLEACPVPVQMTNARTGELIFKSPETIALFGHVDNARDYYVDPADREQYLDLLIRRGAVDNHKVRLIDARGREFWGAISARVIEFNGEQVVVSNTRDMTRELAVQEELASQRELIFQNEKMSALGELLAGVAHELNNPLSVVVGHALMLREETSDPAIIKRIGKISSSAERCARIVKTFLAMARQRPAKMERLNLEAIFATAAEVAGFAAGGNNIEVRTNVSDGLPEIFADPDQITQVLLNLMINSEQAMAKSKKGDRIDLAAQRGRTGRAVEITITDNGPGIAENLRPRVFEPFFTTKEVGEGTGIGLAFCHRIMHSHGGNIWLDSEYRNGCRFVLSLPLRRPATATAGRQSNADANASEARILVVDDESDVADLIADILKMQGYTVAHASSGKTALELLRGGDFNVVLSDLNMPEMDGRGLFDAIRSEFPHLLNGIAFITGDAMGLASQKFLAEANCLFVEKPISPAELRGVIQQLLASQETGG